MKTKILLATVLVGLLASQGVASVAKGQKLFSKKLKKPCEMSGAKVSLKHTQDQWENLYNSKKLKDEIKVICPKVEYINEKYLPHLYEFFYEYASDSGNVPSC